MARYIDLEELERRIKEHIKAETPEEKPLLEWCKDECIRQGYAMPAADVVEVVRCEKCKFAAMLLDIIGDTHLFCAERDFREVGDDDFCSHGKRREVCEKD